MSSFARKTIGEKIISFIFKILLVFLILIGITTYLLYSNVGESNGVIHDFKAKINNKIKSIYNNQVDSIEVVVRKELGIEKQNTLPDNVKPETSVNKNIPEKNVTSSNDYPEYKIPFYYDHSNAPNGVSKEAALKMLASASDSWTKACGVVFEYKGDKLADYVNDKSTLRGEIGIIKWNTQMEGEAIGEAHLGNSRGPASGFVLSMFTDYFNANNNKDLVNTMTHEMGHVIGLPHSANKNSIMFPTEHNTSVLQNSDKAMCQYLRHRWSGLSKDEAESKSGIVFNGGGYAE